MTTENYVYKKEVDWSLLNEGLTLPFDNQVIFGQIMGRFLKRGESKDITLYLDGKSYKAKITNVNFDPKFKRKKDTLQIRYSKNGELAKALQMYFAKSYQFIKTTNEFLISSHHPLRETIMEQTGRTEADRTLFLKDIDKRAINILIHRWDTLEKAEPTF